MTISIRPHHLLDIYKLYGRGIYPFSPDTKYGHDFYLLGNLLIGNKVDSIILVNKADDICIPCKYHENGVCLDSVSIGEFKRKHEYNNFIDSKLFQYFHLTENTLYNVDALLLLFIQQMSPDLFCKVWCFNHDNQSRFTDTLNGITKYIYKK